MKIKRSMALTALVSAATLVLAACGGGSGDDEASDTVKIGVVLPFTGVQATIAKLEGQGAEVAAKEINDAGGIDGKWKIELVDVDDQLDPARSATVIRQLNDEGVELALGGQTSDLCKSSAEATQRFNITFIGAHCTSPELVDPPITPNFFMTGQQMPELGKAFGKGIAKRYSDIEEWDVLTYDVEAMRGGWDTTKATIESELGGTVEVGKKYHVPVGGTSMRKEISGLVSTGDKSKRGLFLGVYGGGTTSFIQQAKPTGILEEYGVIVQSGVYWPTATAMDGEAPPIYNTHDYFYACQDNEMNDNFVSEFEELAGEKPDTGAYQGYIAVKALAEAISKAGSISSDDVQEALKGLSIDTPMGTPMVIDAETHAGNGSVTTAMLKGDSDSPQGVSIDECDIFPVGQN